MSMNEHETHAAVVAEMRKSSNEAICPCHEGNGCNYFIWAQLPYEEGGEK